jgi:hypothetical protein
MRFCLCALISAALTAPSFAPEPAIAFSPAASSSPRQSASRAYTPRPGSPERKAVLDAVRGHLGIKNQFEVLHLKINQGWAFFRGNALYFEQGEKLEVDSIMALLKRAEKSGKRVWQVESIWSLEKDSDQPLENYLEMFRKRQRDDRIPADIFPEDIMKPQAN